MDAPGESLGKDEQEFLLDAARKTIIEHAQSGKAPDFTSENPGLNRKCGVFVTINEKSGALRGCIGYIEPIKPLLHAIIDMSVACSSRDPRFQPVTPDEFSNLDVQISVLAPLEEIHKADDVCVGEHGLLIKKGTASGLLLPQVASEYGWDRQRFLEETCRKAGLETGAWKEPDSKLFVFSAQVFGGSLL